MTVREFDEVTSGTVDYAIYDHDKNEIVETFTRDLIQEADTYCRNLVKFDKYADAKIKWVFSMNDIIRVNAMIN